MVFPILGDSNLTKFNFYPSHVQASVHSSHLTQLLDVTIFGPLKSYRPVRKFIRTEITWIQKVEWLSAHVKAHNAVFKHHNIQGGFPGTGIFPYCPSNVLDRVASQSSISTSERPTIPITSEPFNDSVLTSSPIDINQVQTANIALVK